MGAFWIGSFVTGTAWELQTKNITPAASAEPLSLNRRWDDMALMKMYSLVNRERAKASLPELSLLTSLNNSAKLKCSDMVAKRYFEHTSPDGVLFGDLIKKNSAGTGYLGENLGMSNEGVDGVVVGWMASPSHKANILNPNFHYVGYDYCYFGEYKGYNGVTAVVQHFSEKP